MFRTQEGDYFLYTNGGNASLYPTENITPYTKAKALKWAEEN